MIVKTFPVPADGIEVRVTELADGRFSITVVDTDAAETVGAAVIFKATDRSRALTRAARIALGVA